MSRSASEAFLRDELDQAVARLAASGSLPGLSLAVVEDGRIVYSAVAGVREVGALQAVTEETVFEAASLSKPVFAYAVLSMVDDRVLSLDEPLVRHLPGYFEDERAARIAARHVLTHTTGLPNWRSKTYPLRTCFEPGSSFSYSGEGFVYLQAIVEHVTGVSLEHLMRRLVFEPLAMTSSSFVWQPPYEENHAMSHDAARRPLAKFKPVRANAAFSLHTTAVDFARFVAAVGRPSTALSGWFDGHVRLPRGASTRLDPKPDDAHEEGVAWGLGWGLEPDEGSFFHWGANDGAGAFVLGSTNGGRSFVVFVNRENGFDIAPSIARIVLPGDHPSFRWLGLEE